MKALPIIALPIFLLFLSGFSNHAGKDVINYLNTSDTIVLDNVSYKLAWSSHPAENYYKQEYVPAHERVGSYSSMILIDFLITPDSVKTIVRGKVHELQNRENQDIMAHHQILKSNNMREYLLDFILGDGGSGSPNIVEWNGYRYADYTDSQGHKGVLLFGLSKRAYRSDIMDFLLNLHTAKSSFMRSLAQHPMPGIEVK